jgi:hypothetical protein
VKYIFATTTAQRGKKLNTHANTPAVHVKMNDINPIPPLPKFFLEKLLIKKVYLLNL